MTGTIDIGLKFDGSDEFPHLKTGCTSECFHDLGISERMMQALTTVTINTVSPSACFLFPVGNHKPVPLIGRFQAVVRCWPMGVVGVVG